MPATIQIDGSLGEGGGQVLRTSLALASLLQQPVSINNIRANRRQPGLKTQHLAGVLALAQITDAEVQGAHLHSTALVFKPKTLKSGKYRFEITTAGASSMLLGAILPALLFAPQPSEITITGGTHVPFSPPFHYFDGVFLPILKRLGGVVTLKLERWGFYPKGGGRIRAWVKPCRSLQGAQLTSRGDLQLLQLAACSSSDLAEHIIQREISRSETRLKAYNDKLRPQALTFDSYSPGNFVFLEATYKNSVAGFSSLGKKGRPAEEVADEVCSSFQVFENTKASVDRYISDQILLYLALAEGSSIIIAETITNHLLTNLEIIKKFLPVSIQIENSTGHINVKGIGFRTD